MADLDKITNALVTKYGEEALDDEELRYAERIKYAISVLLDYPHLTREAQVKMVMDQLQIVRSAAYQLFSEAQIIFPSMEKVNKAFERARIIHLIYKFLEEAKTKKNVRDAALLLKLLIDITGVNEVEAQDYNNRVINVFQTDPSALGIKMPEDFNLDAFINQVEKSYKVKQKSNVEYEE